MSIYNGYTNVYIRQLFMFSLAARYWSDLPFTGDLWFQRGWGILSNVIASSHRGITFYKADQEILHKQK